MKKSLKIILLVAINFVFHNHGEAAVLQRRRCEYLNDPDEEPNYSYEVTKNGFHQIFH